MMGAVSDVHPPDPDLARDIDGCCRLTGEFTLRSGQVANEYFDKYLFEADPTLLARVARAMVQLLPEDTELVGGLELGGVPIATMVLRPLPTGTNFTPVHVSPDGRIRDIARQAPAGLPAHAPLMYSDSAIRYVRRISSSESSSIARASSRVATAVPVSCSVMDPPRLVRVPRVYACGLFPGTTTSPPRWENATGSDRGESESDA